MGNCELIEKCLFFNDQLKKMPNASDMMKNIYCRWNYKKCARYRVASALSSKEVPSDLFPSDSFRASQILIQHEKK